MKRRREKEQIKPFINTLYAVIASRHTTEKAAQHGLYVLNQFITEYGYQPLDSSIYYVRQA